MSRPVPSLRRSGRRFLHLGLVAVLLAAISLSAVRLMELAYRYTPVEAVRDGILEQLREWTSADGKPFHPQQAKNVITTYSDALADYASARKELIRPDLPRALALYLALPEGVKLDRMAIDQEGEAFYLYCSLTAERAPQQGEDSPAGSWEPLSPQAYQEEAERLAEVFSTALLSQRVFEQVEQAGAPPSSDFVLVVSWREPAAGTIAA